MWNRFMAVAVAGLVWMGVAQAQAQVRAVLPPPLMVVQGAEQPIRLQSLRVEAALSGSMAQTTLRMVFFNPNHRPLEGRLQFPLLPGQQVSAFALDLDGKMRAAVPVEKARGRQILEAIERRNVDPALLEQTQGNNFQLRVFPIPAQGTRTVELSYSETLGREGANWAYQLPLAYGELAQGVDLRVTVAGDAAPQASGAIGNIVFERSGDGYKAQLARASYAASGVLKLLVPAPVAPQTYVQQFGGETYFLVEMPSATQRTPRVLPKVLGLLWDSSGSGAQRRHDAELAELDRYFQALGNAEVRLTRLRDRAEAVQRFRVVNGDWQALRKALQDTVYDGASALADWQPQADVNDYLLVSDGLLNYGGKQFPQLSSRQRLSVLNSAVSADAARLSALAERNGGKLVTVQADRPGAAAAMLLTDGQQVRLTGVRGATDVLISDDDAPQGMLRVAGKLVGPHAEVTLALQQQGKLRPLQLDIAATAPSHPMAARAWAGYKLHQLEADYELNRGAIRRLGTQFGMPTRETSLLVLERLEDYVRYDVQPPAELQAAFDALKRLRGGELAQRRGNQLERVVRQFERKLAWWEGRSQQPQPRLPSLPGKLTRVEVTGSANAADRVAEERQRVPQPSPSPVAAPAPMFEAMPAPAPQPFAARAPVSAPAPPPAPLMALRAPSPVVAASAAERPSSNADIAVSLKRWDANAGYIARMKAASPDQLYAIYLDERPSYLNSSAFYIDVADQLFERGKRDLALRVLSNLAEMDLENRQVLRILGYRLLQAGQPALAIPVFEKVRELAEEEPQSFRDLGLAYAAAGRAQQAIDQLYEVMIRPWDGRFAEIELIALADMNAIIAAAPARAKLDTSRIDQRLLKNMPLDLRVVLSWDADNADMDLWVTDPSGERCYYGHGLTQQGGRLSQDFTGGYGPEEFSLRRALPGKYKVEANFFGSRQQIVAGATTLQLKLTSGFGRAGARDQMVTLRLQNRGETALVGEFEVK